MAQPVIEEEKQYSILKNAAGDLMMLMRARLNDAEMPQMIYDGGEHALLYRSKDNTIFLGYIHPEIREELSQANSILIVEAQSGSIIREYNSHIKHLKKIPLPQNQ